MPNKIEPAFLKPSRFAVLVDFHRSKIYDMLLRGELRGTKIGGCWRIPTSELDRFRSEAEKQEAGTAANSTEARR